MNGKRKKGFTIVELLGVFIILGIIAVIITPNILKLQEESEKDAFEQSVNALIRSAQVYYANNDFINFPESGISPTDPELELKNNTEFKSGVVKLINDEYFYAYNISNGKYCANGVRNDISIDEGECPETPSRCFDFDEETNTITSFNNDKVGCDIPNPVIPEEINGKTVEHIGDLAFAKGYYVCEKDGEVYHEGSEAYEWYEEYVIFDHPKNIEKAKQDVEAKFLAKYGNKDYTYESTFCYATLYKPIGYDEYHYTCPDCGAKDDEYFIKYEEAVDKTLFPNRLTGVTLPKTIKTIGVASFALNDIAFVNINELQNLEVINEDAFYKNNLKTIDFGENKNLKVIDYESFDSNEINSINLTGLDNLEVISGYAFYNNKLKTVAIKDLPNLKSINIGAFAYNQINNLDMNNLPKLESMNAFQSNAITSFDFSKFPTLKVIGGFANNKLTSIDISNLPNLQVIGSDAFYKNTTLENINFQNLPKLEGINSYAFNECSLTSLHFNNVPKLRYLDSYAFFGNKITSLNFTNSYALEWTGIYLFSKNLITSFDFSIFPELYYIGGHTMSHNYNTLTEITLDNPKLEYIGDFAFDYNYQLRTVNMGENPSLIELANGVFKWSPVQHIVIPKNVTILADTNYYRTNEKALSVTVYGENPQRFNSRWSSIGITGGASNCPVIPSGTNTVSCS